MAIQPTEAPNVTRVLVYITSTAPNSKPDSVTFYITPDGKHIIDGPTMVYFSATPYSETRALLKARANGAARELPASDPTIVEFADLQCPYCKLSQTTMDQIVKDFPAAHVVFQQLPLVDIHASAFKAAAYGVCAQKQGDDAFFKYAAGVFDTQQGLTPATDDTLLKAAAMRAGLDGDAIALCAKTQATKDIVNADIKLAEEVGINQTPILVVNGRPISANRPLRHDQAADRLSGQAGRCCHRRGGRYSGSHAAPAACPEQSPQIVGIAVIHDETLSTQPLAGDFSGRL